MTNEKLKFVFFGTPSVASLTLQILKDHQYIPELIITSPDKRSGRGLIMTASPVATWAKENNIKCLKPEKINDDFIAELSTYLPKDETFFNLYIVVAYGKILPENLIKSPKLGTINIHYSLLPKYRGASPLEATFLNGEEVTGISIQQMEFKLDSGPILQTEKIEIGIEETKEEIKEELIKLGANSLCDILPKLISREIIPKIQNENEATFCKKIKKEDGEIDIQSENQRELWNKYRAFYGWPGVFFFVPARPSGAGGEKSGKRLRIKIKEATYENNSFVIKQVIPEGRKEMSYEEFLRWS